MANRSAINEDGRVWELTRIEVITLNRHSEYEVRAKKEAVLGPTGAWDFLSIQHCSGWPVYKARWDERQSTLDFDKLLKDSRKRFKDFPGHHTERDKDDVWEFEVDINEHGIDIFRGSVCFSLTRKMTMQFEAKVDATFEAEVIRAERELNTPD